MPDTPRLPSSAEKGIGMRYVEIYADEDGVSHFRDLDIEFTIGEVAPPALPVGLSAFRAATEVGFISIPSKLIPLAPKLAAFTKGAVVL